ncbi:MAG: hypothetical protein LUD03_03560 [Firmicutes bacterium]|nr:hypothetical protein [Bacillota bacterium]
MWTEVYVSQNSEKVGKLIQILENSRIISKVKRINNEGASDMCFEVLVPKTELEETQNIIVESDLF